MGHANYVRANFILPTEIYHALRVLIPERSRSKVVTDLIKKEITRREKELYRSTTAVEKDQKLNMEMEEWTITLNDGLGELDSSLTLENSILQKFL